MMLSPTSNPRFRRLLIWVFSFILIWMALVHLFALCHTPLPISPLPPPSRIYKSNGFLKISCNGGLNQMRSAICDMVTVAYLLNLTLVVPELDKTSFWADTSNFGDIFDVRHFIDSLRDEVCIIKRLPKKISRTVSNDSLTMRPVSWSSDKYYLEQIDVLEVEGVFYGFSGCHCYKAHQHLGLPAIRYKIRRGTKETLRHHMR